MTQELQAYSSEHIYWAVEQVEREAGDIDILHLDDNLFYLKSEADKVIAEKDKELRHHKFKWCLAMAKWCAADCVVNQNTYKKFLTHKSEFRIMHFRKWYFRWLELAEKFKETKCQ